MDLRVVLVQPEHELNVGHAARAMKNFGFEELVLVAPKINVRGFEARKYAKHAGNVLEKAKVAKSLGEAVDGCELVVGTTGILQRSPDALRNPITPKLLAQKAREFGGKIALVFGREGIGLSEKEIQECDFVVSIPANREYPVLNLSHAIAVILYELHALKKPRMIKKAKKGEREALEKIFGGIVDVFRKDLRNPGKVKLAFKRVLAKSILTEIECGSLIGVFRRANERLKRG